MKLDPELKAKWVAALRGGKYKQGQMALRRKNDTFCCLGVLCDIVDPALWIQGNDSARYGYGVTWVIGYPPEAMFNIKWQEVHLTIDGQTLEIAGHNDRGRTFAQIADAIEQQL